MDRRQAVIDADALGRNELAARLRRYQTLPGLRRRRDRERFTDCLDAAVTDLARLASGRLSVWTVAGPGPSFNPFATAIRLGRSRRREAAWLALLATHQGWDRPDSCGVLFRGLGAEPRWTLRSVEKDGGRGLERWVGRVWHELTELAPFGNHRKYLTHRPSAPVSTGDTLRSGASWVVADGYGSRSARTPEAAFDDAYRSLGTVRGFGRTGRYDYLRLLGLLGIAPVWPGRCYLEGASGPRRGAALLFADQEPDGVPVPWLEDRCMALATGLDVDLQAVEDAVCNWQKPGWCPPASGTLNDS